MVLFLSDMHFGRGDSSTEREKERDLIAFLRGHEDQIEHLYLLGDVFEAYIEYRHLIPKGFVRLQGALAEMCDRGLRVSYLVGNHDSWHVDYFSSELGIELLEKAATVEHQGVRLHLAHGDTSVERSWVESRLKGWLRHPIPVFLYKNLLPGDLGMRLARFVNHNFGNRAIDRDLVERLRVHARHLLFDSELEAVVFGHSHWPELSVWPEGTYLNTGYWHESRTFGRLYHGGLALMRWNGRETVIVQD